jgi:hypothetical protein
MSCSICRLALPKCSAVNSRMSNSSTANGNFLQSIATFAVSFNSTFSKGSLLAWHTHTCQTPATTFRSLYKNSIVFGRVTTFAIRSEQRWQQRWCAFVSNAALWRTPQALRGLHPTNRTAETRFETGPTLPVAVELYDPTVRGLLSHVPTLPRV